MNKYQVFVDTVEKEEDWGSDEAISVMEFIIKATSPEEAMELMEETMVKSFPNLYWHVWSVTDGDILNE